MVDGAALLQGGSGMTAIYLPSLPLVGEEGAWDGIATLIRADLLPRIEAVGDALFRAPLHPLPSDASIVPIVSENWSRPRQDGTPQFVYLVRGHGLMLVERKLLMVTSGHGFYLPKGALYAPYLMRNGQVLPCDWLWFKVHPFGVVVLRSRLTPAAHYQSAHFVIPDRQLTHLFYEWERESHLPAPDWRLTKGLLIALFGLLMRSSPLLPPEGNRHEQDLPLPLQHALTALHRAYNKPITLHQLATYCGVSLAYFCRLFKKHLGITPWRYLERIRLQVAQYLLRETELSVADVAFLAGFNDLRNFQRLFKRVYGKPPTALRRRKKTRSAPVLRVWD